MELDFELPKSGTVHCDFARDIVQVQNGFAYVDEDKLDIFSQTSLIIPEWKPNKSHKKYEELTRVYLDIETEIFDATDDDIRTKASKKRTMMIGIRNEKGDNIVIRSEDEREMYRELFWRLEKKQPDLLFTHNGMWFDLPFIHWRCHLLGIKCPFWIDYDGMPSSFASARIAGMYWNVSFRAVHIRLDSGKKVNHLDTYMLAIGFDAVARSFTSYTLKSLPLQLGLRDSERLDLGVEGIQECYDKQDWERLSQYQIYDIEDTQLLADRFAPEVVNQQAFFPGFTIQALATVGVGTKWQAAMTNAYGERYVEQLPEPVKIRYKGALTIAKASLATDIVSADFSGQYPTCMMQYGITSEADVNNYMLAILQSAVDERMALKYKENPTRAEIEFVTTVKSVVNGAYGALASRIPFGDTKAAALVTAFARARLKWSKKFVEALGGEVVLSDTDSIYIKANDETVHLRYPLPDDVRALLPVDASDRFLSALAIIELLKKFIPVGSKLDIDSINRAVFVPPVTISSEYNKSYKFSSVNGKKLLSKVLLECLREQYEVASNDDDFVVPAMDFAIVEQRIKDNDFTNAKVTFDRLKIILEGYGFPIFHGIKKNYIRNTWNIKKQSWQIKMKGRFVKRDKSRLEKTFQSECLLRLVTESYDSANSYYQTELCRIMSGEYPIEDLAVTRKIAKSEKKLVDLGFGKPRETITFWIGQDDEPTQSGKYSIEHYSGKLIKLWEEITCLI